MAGSSAAEIAGMATVLLGAKLDSVVGSLMASTTSSDPKNPVDLIKIAVLDALALVASIVARSPLSDDAFLFCIQESDLGSGDGQYHINKTVITGPIVCVNVSYDSSAFTYKYAERDSASAIQDYRVLRTASRRIIPLLSWDLVGETIFYPGTRIQVTFVPGDVGEAGSDIDAIPRKYADWALAKTLAILFPRDGGQIGAAQHYNSIDQMYTQLVISGNAQLPPFQPYSGS
jgi:hypothetical protein